MLKAAGNGTCIRSPGHRATSRLYLRREKRAWGAVGIELGWRAGHGFPPVGDELASKGKGPQNRRQRPCARPDQWRRFYGPYQRRRCSELHPARLCLLPHFVPACLCALAIIAHPASLAFASSGTSIFVVPTSLISVVLVRSTSRSLSLKVTVPWRCSCTLDRAPSLDPAFHGALGVS